jgi:hypothetical protein
VLEPTAGQADPPRLSPHEQRYWLVLHTLWHELRALVRQRAADAQRARRGTVMQQARRPAVFGDEHAARMLDAQRMGRATIVLSAMYPIESPPDQLITYQEAAIFVAEGQLAAEQISRQCGIAHRTLACWQERAAFRALVEQYREQLWNEVLDGLLCQKRRRLAWNERWFGLQQVIRARGATARARELAGHRLLPHPAADTGLYAMDLQVGRHGFREHWRLEHTLLDELAALRKLAARAQGEAGFVCSCAVVDPTDGHDPPRPSADEQHTWAIRNTLWHELRALVRQRAADATRAAQDGRRQPPAPGAESGWLACERKRSRVGLLEIWRLDRATLRQLRALEIAAARYRGEAGFVCRCRKRVVGWSGAQADPPPPSLKRADELLTEIRELRRREFAARGPRLAA